MRTDRIHEIDLACIAPLPTAMKREALRKLKAFVPPHTFQPVRKMVMDIFNVRPNPFISHQDTPWQYIEQRIEELSKSDSEEAANLSAADGLYRYARANGIRGEANHFARMSLGQGALSYWSNVILNFGGTGVVPFLDPRITGGLTPLGMRFAFSAMHRHIRQQDIDFYECSLVILRLSPPTNGRRHVEAHFDNGVDLFPYLEMKEMVRETYKLWGEVLAERAAQEPRPRERKRPSAQMDLPFVVPFPQRKAS